MSAVTQAKVVDWERQYDDDRAAQAAFLRSRGWVQKKHGWHHPKHGGSWLRWGAMKHQIQFDEHTRYAREALAGDPA